MSGGSLSLPDYFGTSKTGATSTGAANAGMDSVPRVRREPTRLPRPDGYRGGTSLRPAGSLSRLLRECCLFLPGTVSVTLYPQHLARRGHSNEYSAAW